MRLGSGKVEKGGLKEQKRERVECSLFTDTVVRARLFVREKYGF